MGLEIRQNPFEYTHENVAFRKIAKNLEFIFKDWDWHGLLLGNPYCEDNASLQLDILLYGPEFCIIFDLKDYEGIIELPDDNEFESAVWKIKGKDVVVKGGSFINPYVQLKNQRNEVLKIIKNEVKKSSTMFRDVNYSHLQSAVLFQNNIKLSQDISGVFNRNFFITDLEHLPQNLLDIKSGFKFRLDWATLLKGKFKADPYDIEIEIPGVDNESKKSQFKKWNSEEQVFQHVEAFIDDRQRSAHVIQGPVNSGKLSLAYNIRESMLTRAKVSNVEILTLSQRVAAFLNKQHPELNIKSLYSTIYGGEPEIIEKELENGHTEELEIIPVRSVTETFETNSLYIILEANLLSNSYQEFPLSRFGSGHLIDDLFEYLGLPDSNCNLLLIGDPYQISYGAWDEAALNTNFLESKLNSEVVTNNIQPEISHLEKSHIIPQILRIPQKIDQDLFNELEFQSSESLKLIEKNSNIPGLLKEWEERNNEFAFLTYKNEDVDSFNKWYKEKILEKKDELNQGDRLLIYKGCIVPTENPFDKPHIIASGSFVKIEEIGSIETFTTKPKGQNQVELKFQQIKIMPENSNTEVEVFMLENFRKSIKGELTKSESIALKILLNKKVEKLKDENPFKDSDLFKFYMEDVKTQSLMESIWKYEQMEILDKHETEELKSLRKQLEAHKNTYVKRYNWKLKKQVFNQDPLLNAIYAKHGWALTVDKSLGGKWDYIILNANRGDQGIKNKDYFKWLYSGLSRAAIEAAVLNFESISPLKECVFSTNPPQKIQTTNAGELNLDIILQDERLQATTEFVEKYFSDNQYSEAIIRYAHYLSGAMEGDSWKLDEIITRSNFLVKLKFSKEEKVVIIVFNYDKNQKVKQQARIEKVENIKKEEILNEISLMPQIAFKKLDFDQLPSDFRRPIYSQWIVNLDEKNLKVIGIQEFKFQDRVKIVYEKNWLTFNVDYDSGGFLTHVKSFRATNPGLWDMVLPLLKM